MTVEEQKTKRAAYYREWYNNNKNKVKEYDKRIYNKKYEYLTINNAKRRQTIKIKAMELLGGLFCKKCGYTDIRALQIDHVKGGGSKETKKIQTMGVYKKIINDPSCRADYQVLCANCNRIKVFTNKEFVKRRVSKDDK